MEDYYWILFLITSLLSVASVVWFCIKGDWGDHPVFWENALNLMAALLVFCLSFFVEFKDFFSVCMGCLAHLFLVCACAAGVLSMYIYDRGGNPWARKLFCYIPTFALFSINILIWINVYEPEYWNQLFGRFM